MQRHPIIKNLLERDDSKCVICGKALSIDSAEIHHIIPKAKGGTSELENLVLICNEHNFHSENLRNVDFVKMLITLMDNDSKFKNIQSEPKFNVGDNQIFVDISAEKLVENKWQQVIIECKLQYVFTLERIRNIIDQLVRHRQHLLFSNINVKCIFAFPGTLTEKFKHSFEDAEIEVWDLVFLANRFDWSVLSIDNPIFLRMFKAAKARIEISFEEELIEKLKNCLPGKEEWVKYQKLVGEILEELFCPPLGKPISELSDYSNINRRDFILPNYIENGFWAYLRSKYAADYIVIDAKNYKGKLKKEQALQIANYLKSYGAGLFGMIVCRNGADNNCISTLREIWLVQKKMIVIITDNDIEQMLLDKQNKIQPEITIQQKIEDFRLSL